MRLSDWAKAGLIALAAILSTPAGAEEREDLLFDVRIAGIKAGELQIASRTNDTRYSLRGRLESTGLVAFVRKVRYDADVQGRVLQMNRLQPEFYREETNTGRRVSAAEMGYRDGVPDVQKTAPPRAPDPRDVDPSTQGGALDVLTALFVILRDRPDEAACGPALRTFDGRRAARVDMTPKPESRGRGILCRGVYTRVAGFSEEDMAERRVFPFTVMREAGENGHWRVTRIDVQSLYGRAQLLRR